MVIPGGTATSYCSPGAERGPEGARPAAPAASVLSPVVVDEPDDWSDPGAPLPPEDRLWRHPSELARAASPAATVAGTRRRGRRRGLVTLAVLSGITGATATIVALAAMGSLSPRTVERIERVAAPVAPAAVPTTSRSARAIASSVAPAVVEVTATVGVERRRGSGVVMTTDGLILTSSALVADATSVMVRWPSGRSGAATTHGHDDLTGLAALAVPGSDFPTATIDLSPPKPGETAITVASGTGSQGPTLTQGMVSSSQAHADPEAGRLLGLIETDRPVPGWADGGALVDGEGRLRGVCLSVPAHPATGWAVPVEVAQRVAEDLSTMGRVDRGWLGVRGAPSDPVETDPVGVGIDEVGVDSPAEAAGLLAGDVIVAVDRAPVRSLADVQAALTLTRPDQVVRVERARAGETTTVDVTLAETPR